MQTNLQKIEALRAALPEFTNPRDTDFAISLLRQYGQRDNLSEKQWPYVESLIHKANHGDKPREKEAIGDLSGILALFDKASQNGLKRPAIVLSVEGVGSIKISVAGENAKVPGSLNVINKDESDSYGRPLWYGRILKDGDFEKSPRATAPAALLSKLHAFAQNPLKVAAEHGKITGCCCFCNRTLTDAKSVEQGYGPVCAKKWAGAQ